ncbi:MAG: DUF5069 domain-containing protein [Akkermansiaceae bacterium]|nr:DUF5069 domain-containing protein [Akkermansiaceae bacterium]
MMSIVPTISSGTTGPLGVKHLPRLWQKVSLDAVGKLNPEYPAIGAGFDAMTLGALGLEEQAVKDYVKAEKPNYVQFEQWCQQNGTVDQAKVAEHNKAVDGYNHDDDTRKGILGAVGLPADTQILDAVNLNNLEDWNDFHKSEVAG